MKKELSSKQREELLSILKARFEKNMSRHKGVEWAKVQVKLKDEKLWSLNEMERTGGEPDVVGYDTNTDKYIFYDCSAESPKGRGSLVTTVKRWMPGKNINQKIAPLIWLHPWALNY